MPAIGMRALCLHFFFYLFCFSAIPFVLTDYAQNYAPQFLDNYILKYDSYMCAVKLIIILNNDLYVVSILRRKFRYVFKFNADCVTEACVMLPK